MWFRISSPAVNGSPRAWESSTNVLRGASDAHQFVRLPEQLVAEEPKSFEARNASHKSYSAIRPTSMDLFPLQTGGVPLIYMSGFMFPGAK